jgi:carbonic anhydrase
MEAHFIHKFAEGSLSVPGVFLTKDEENRTTSTNWNNVAVPDSSRQAETFIEPKACCQKRRGIFAMPSH